MFEQRAYKDINLKIEYNKILILTDKIKWEFCEVFNVKESPVKKIEKY